MRKLTIDATPENLAIVFKFMQDAFSEYEIPKKQMRQIKLCVEEIYINIANYAYTPSTGKAGIAFDFWGAAGGTAPLSVKISFEDSGKPYNPLEKEDPDIELDLDDTPIGGLGIFIVKETMDNVWYERRGGHNIFIMEKELIPVSEREPEKAVS